MIPDPDARDIVRSGYDALSLRYRADDAPAGQYATWIVAPDRAGPAAIPHADPDLHDGRLPVAPAGLSNPRQGTADQCPEVDEFAGAARGEH